MQRFQADKAWQGIDIGGRDINGTARGLFPATRWIVIDLEDGPDVDVVCDAEEYVPSEPVDLVLCTEVCEHAPRWPEIVMAAATWLKPGGILILTAAGLGRQPHSMYDGGALRENEYYQNLTVGGLESVVVNAGLQVEVIEYDGISHDVRVFARRPEPVS